MATNWSLRRYVWIRLREALVVTRDVFWEQYGKAWLLLYFSLGGLAIYKYLDDATSIRAEIKTWGIPLITGVILIAVLFGAVYWFSAYRIWRLDQQKLSQQAKEIGDLTEHRLECFDVSAHISEHKVRDVLNPTYHPAKYVKVGVRSKGSRVRGCKAFLTSATQILEFGSLDVSNFDALALQWSLREEREIDIPDNFDVFFDVLRCDGMESKLKFCEGVISPIRMRAFFNPSPAKFKLVVKVISDDAPTLIQDVYVDWGGTVETLTASRKL
ncbi:MAG: hypothetical protein ABI769_10215 [Pseudomonadota bacterium]